ncbi:hypothetical protein SAMN02800694_2167 [Luteibacter sp. UNCMF331Sha3.1]|uniref:hypothetical protein n=1 Tax=Luteibacter sp. UNCMF331Sha3.1 TaxID=1502760 RepID=UPI0008CDED06|nr:hypothetical protein [Luteibacter sp. UNCMF331Sha3.1]SEM92697.1 hypothetical protein SAMN02800694_2167 [Luteibacter sp. UNCMF331Sha3.1]
MIELLERNRSARVVAFLAAAALTVVIYRGGLHGPFLIDDIPNLDTIQRWVEGRLNWRSAIDNRSGPLGRSVSMLSFLADAARSGAMDPATFKTTNLLIHIICGALSYVFCRQIFRRMEATREVASACALFVVAWWLFIPLHVSTVLYIVQRMAQLGALFTILALTVYVAIRQRLERGASGRFVLILWTVFPLIVGVGAFAKENAVLAIPLALLTELLCFPSTPASPRPRPVTWFFFLTVAMPGILATAWLATHPAILTSGYQIRPFTLTERILTEPRVLWSYVKTMLLPVGDDMGLFHDTYRLSTGLFSPWTTAAAIAGWLAAIGLAIALRKRSPLIALGIGFFLIGHLLESTVVPLEIYFEHRNYLPDLGILIAITGAARELWARHRTPTAGFRQAVMLGAPSLLVIYAVATWIQAGAWGNADTLFAMQESYNPDSPRLQSTLAARDIGLGNTQSALEHIALSETHGPENEKMTATLWRLIAYRSANLAIPPDLYTEFEHRTGYPITLNAMRYWERLTELAEDGGVDTRRLANAGRRWIDHDGMHAGSQVVWRSRYNLARMEAASGNLEQAERDARKAWIDSDYSNGVAVVLFQLNATLGRRDACQEILAMLRRRQDPGNADLTQAIALFTKALADGSIGRPAPSK